MSFLPFLSVVVLGLSECFLFSKHTVYKNVFKKGHSAQLLQFMAVRKHNHMQVR